MNEPNFAKVHRLAGEMRRKLTEQSTELAATKSLRVLVGIAKADRETNYLVDENGEYFQ
jgi:hypothetical protein